MDYDEKLNDGTMKADLDEALNTQLKTISKVPKEKWNIPQTANQEIGWYANVRYLIRLRKSRTRVSSCTKEQGVPKLIMLITITP